MWQINERNRRIRLGKACFKALVYSSEMYRKRQENAMNNSQCCASSITVRTVINSYVTVNNSYDVI